MVLYRLLICLFIFTEVYIYSVLDDICTESELQISLEWRELEERLRKEEEQKLTALEVERELQLNSEREEEERRRKGLMKFEEELKKIEAGHSGKLVFSTLKNIYILKLGVRMIE